MSASLYERIGGEAAVMAAVILYLFERRRPDKWILLLVGLLLGLYLIDANGGHGIAWAQGTRLVVEPLLLLLVGLTLNEPLRTFRYSMAALVIVCCFVAAYGIVQQIAGEWTVVSWGYSFSEQVRTAYGHLRSFGTLDDPSDYAWLLALGLAAVFLWRRRGPLAWAAACLILVGLGASLVRTAILLVFGLVGLVLWRRGFATSKALVAVAVALVIAGGVTLAVTTGTQTKNNACTAPGHTTAAQGSANCILNGRATAWSRAFGPGPTDWLLGRGVGVLGAGAQRAALGLTPSATSPQNVNVNYVDSGYLQTVADVGLAGLAVLLALFGRLLVLGAAAARANKDAGWVVLGLLAVLLIAALTGSAFTGFPGAFLAMLLVGVALAAAREESDPSSPDVPARAT